MTVFVVCRGEYGEGRSPIGVFRHVEDAISEALSQPYHGDPWEDVPFQEVGIREWRSECDRVSVRTFEIQNQSKK